MHKWSTNRIWAVGYVIVVLGLVFSFYVDKRQDAFDARRDDDIDEATARTVKCVFEALQKDAEQTRELRDVAQDRDDDLVAAVTALKVLVKLRVLDGVSMNAETDQAGNQFITQADRFIAEAKVVMDARAKNPVPRKICGVVIE